MIFFNLKEVATFVTFFCISTDLDNKTASIGKYKPSKVKSNDIISNNYSARRKSCNSLVIH